MRRRMRQGNILEFTCELNKKFFSLGVVVSRLLPDIGTVSATARRIADLIRRSLSRFSSLARLVRRALRHRVRRRGEDDRDGARDALERDHEAQPEETTDLVIEGINVDEGLRRVAAIREALNIGTRRNIAFAEVEIEGPVEEVIAVSGQASHAGTVALPEELRFSLFSVGPNPRTLDAERKLLENLAGRLTWESQGTVRLFSERIPCPSCAGVIQQFREAFPHIRLVVTHGPGQK